MKSTDALQFFLCMLIFVSLFVQRMVSARFSSSNRVCTGDTVTTKVGQVGMAVSAAAAFALGMEALGWFQTQYQNMIMALLAGEALIGIRVLYSAHLGRVMARRGFWRSD